MMMMMYLLMFFENPFLVEETASLAFSVVFQQGPLATPIHTAM